MCKTTTPIILMPYEYHSNVIHSGAVVKTSSPETIYKKKTFPKALTVQTIEVI